MPLPNAEGFVALLSEAYVSSPANCSALAALSRSSRATVGTACMRRRVPIDGSIDSMVARLILSCPVRVHLNLPFSSCSVDNIRGSWGTHSIPSQDLRHSVSCAAVVSYALADRHECLSPISRRK